MNEKYDNHLKYIIKKEDLDNFEPFVQEFSDVPSYKPKNGIYLKKVGINNAQVLIDVNDLFTQESKIPLVCNINVYLDLSMNRRGIHMSRITEIIQNTANNNSFCDLDEFAKEVSIRVKESQPTNNVYLEINGLMFIKQKAPISHKVSNDRVNLICKTWVNNNLKVKQQIGIEAINITSCPCTQAYSMAVLAKDLSKNYSIDQINDFFKYIIPYSHSQRGKVIFIVEKKNDQINFKGLFEVLRKATHLVYQLLKREDEHALTKDTHSNTQFSEDVARDVVTEFYKQYTEKLSADTYLRVDSYVMESIHAHNIHTVIESTIGEISMQLK